MTYMCGAAMLVERDRELIAATAALRRAVRGRGSAVVVGGEAGIGKSALIREFLNRIPDGVRVLVGGCDDLLAPRALAPLREATANVPGPLSAALAGVSADIHAAAVAQLKVPSVLVLDDVQWADDATLDVLVHLLGKLADLPALLVLGLRPEALDPGHPTHVLLGPLAAAPVLYLDLAPLSRAAVAELAGDRDAAEVHRATGGNPFFVTEALAVPAGALPESIVDAVQARVAGLPAATVSVVERLSVLPGAVRLDLASALLGNDWHALVAAEERGVIEMRSGSLVFRHELARRAVETRLPPLRRRVLHACVVTALRTLGSTDLERLVHHAVGAGDADTVLQCAPAAARAAAADGSHRQALAHLEAAARFAERMQPVEGAEFYDDLGWQLYIAQRFEEAVAASRRGLALLADQNVPELAAQLTSRLSRYLLWHGDIDEAIRLHEHAVSDLIDEEGPLDARASLALHGATLEVFTGRLDEAATSLGAALVLATGAGRPDLRSIAMAYRGMVRAVTGDVAEGTAEVRAGLRLALDRGCDESAARIYSNLVDLLYATGDRAALAAVAGEGQRFCAERGLVQFLVAFDLYEHVLRLWNGNIAAAEEGLRELAGRAAGAAALAPRVNAWLGRVLARRGLPEASELIMGSWIEARRQRRFSTLLHAGLAAVEWAWLSHSTDLARDVADVVLPMMGAPSACVWPRAELSRWLSRMAVPTSPFDGCPPGYAAGIRGDWQTAEELAGDPYERALELGLSPDTAAMADGLAALIAMDAPAVARRIREVMRERGVPRLPSGRSSRIRRQGLTERQVEVLDLIGNGATNAEIARRLVLSVRTVDHHVAAILARLGVQTRQAAVEAFRSADRSSAPET